MGTASQDPRLICRSKISLGSRTWVKLANPNWLENTQVWGEGGGSLWDTKGKNRLGVYQGSLKGKVGCSTTSSTSPYADLEELSPLEGLGVRFLLFREEEEAMKWHCDKEKKKEVEGMRDEEEKAKEEIGRQKTSVRRKNLWKRKDEISLRRNL